MSGLNKGEKAINDNDNKEFEFDNDFFDDFFSNQYEEGEINDDDIKSILKPGMKVDDLKSQLTFFNSNKKDDLNDLNQSNDPDINNNDMNSLDVIKSNDDVLTKGNRLENGTESGNRLKTNKQRGNRLENKNDEKKETKTKNKKEEQKKEIIDDDIKEDVVSDEVVEKRGQGKRGPGRTPKPPEGLVYNLFDDRKGKHYTDEEKRVILTLIRTYLSMDINIKHACRLAGISRVLFYKWREKHPDIEDYIKEDVGLGLAKAKQALFSEAEFNWKASIELLKRRDKKYSEKTNHNIEGKGVIPIAQIIIKEFEEPEQNKADENTKGDIDKADEKDDD